MVTENGATLDFFMATKIGVNLSFCTRRKFRGGVKYQPQMVETKNSFKTKVINATYDVLELLHLSKKFGGIKINQNEVHIGEVKS